MTGTATTTTVVSPHVVKKTSERCWEMYVAQLCDGAREARRLQVYRDLTKEILKWVQLTLE
jgi:hypothetical protein